jgi:Ca-activated chloride channel homolog
MNSSYLPLLIIAILAITIFVYRYEKIFFEWIKRYFFLDRSFENKVSSVFFILAISLLLISLLDFRGPATKHLADIPDQRTIIIIDSSASMLAEDVRPNRFQKSVLLARHFIKKAAGHQIAVVLFSDTQKRLVPFTDDIDLLDARVSGLAKIDIQNGGSNIRQAISESIQYFKAQDSNIKEISGNILVFTDSESNSEKFSLKIPKTVNIAMIGVGTARGAPIPIRNKSGVFRGYKSHNGEKIISKLDESFLRSFGEMAESYKYWVSTSFSIPTEDILDFFRTQHKTKMSKGLVTSRPVYAKWILIPALLFYLLANLLNLRPVFIAGLFLVNILFPYGISYAESNDEQGKKEVALDDNTVRLLNEMKNGKLQLINKLKIAEGLFTSKKLEESKIMYDECLIMTKNIDQKAKLNYGTLLLAMGKINAGAIEYQKLHQDKYVDEKIKKIARENLLLAISKQEQEKKKKDKKKKKKKSDDKPKGDKPENKNDEGKEGQKGKQAKGEKEKKKKNKDEKEEKDKKSNKKETDKKDIKKRKQSLEEKEEEIRKKRKMIKVPAMLKQIMSDDSKLQKTYLDTSTKQKASRNKRKDW